MSATGSSPQLPPNYGPDVLRDPAHPQAPANSGSRHEALERVVRECVSWRPLHSMWDLRGVPPKVVAKRTWDAIFDNNLFGSAAELGYWFLFALFPTLVSASSMVGLAAKSASVNYANLLHYLALVVPPSAYGIVLDTFTQITAQSTGKKVTFGLAAALWAASAGFSAIQDSMNAVYGVKETRPYWKVRGSAVLISTLLSLLVTAILGSLLAGDFLGHVFAAHIYHHAGKETAVLLFRVAGWVVGTGLLLLLFAIIYYWGPNLKQKRWRWMSPGAAIGIIGWAIASVGLRVYLHFFNNYSATYGSLGAVIILLTWFYLTGLMLLLGAQVNSEIEAVATEKHLASLPPEQRPPELVHSEMKPAA